MTLIRRMSSNATTDAGSESSVLKTNVNNAIPVVASTITSGHARATPGAPMPFPIPAREPGTIDDWC
jgi:hypothetical protein